MAASGRGRRTLQVEEQRARGQYATPPALVAEMLDWVGFRAEADLERATLLDPSCGSGNFLCAAGERLLAQGRACGWSEQRQIAALAANLCGIEADPHLLAQAAARLHGLMAPLRAAPHIELLPHSAPAVGAVPRFQLVQGDALTAPTTTGYQYVLGNPPYLSARKHARLLPRKGFESQGQRDAYLFFVEQACRWVAPGGWLGLVLPDAFLVRANAAHARKLLCRAFVLTRLEHRAGVFPAQVGTLVLIAQRQEPAAHFTIAWHRVDRTQARQQQEGTRGVWNVEVWRQQPRAELRYLLGPGEAALLARLAGAAPWAPLGELVTISRGEELARRSKKLLAIQTAGSLPVLRGGEDVLPFRCRFAGVYLPREAVAKPLDRYQASKLLVVKSSGRLCAALDERGAVALQTLYLLHARPGVPALDYLLALLNSRLVRGLLWLYHTAYKLVQPQMEQETLARLALPLFADDAQQELAQLAAELRALAQHQDAAASGHPPPMPPVLPAPCKTTVQLEQTMRDLTTRLNARIAALCGLSADERALLESFPVEQGREKGRTTTNG